MYYCFLEFYPTNFVNKLPVFTLTLLLKFYLVLPYKLCNIYFLS